MADKVDVARVRKLLESLTELREKEQLVIEEVWAAIGGGVGLGAKMRAATDVFADQWAARYIGSKYIFNKKDFPNVKKAVLAIGVEEFSARAWRFLRNNDPWLVKHGHPLSAFLMQINQYAVSETPADHGEDEAERTSTMLQQLRGGR